MLTCFDSQPTISIDGFAMALLIQLLLRDRSLWSVIERVTARVGLILALCTDERKQVINVLKSELRKWDYVPITFDCEQIEKREYKDWLDILARLAKFVTIDITEAKDIAQELPFLVSQHPSVPIQLLVQSSADDSTIPEELPASPSVLETYRYQQVEDIQRDASALIARAEQKAKELMGR